MSETIKIMNTPKSSFQPTVGQKTTDLINSLTKLETDEKETLLKETVEILSNCIPPNELSGKITGIAIGYVQSGKTMSFTTLTTLAHDNGFRIIIYFAGSKNNLLEQTTNRLKKDLDIEKSNAKFFKVYQNPTVAGEEHSDIKRALKLKNNPTILITVLKHYGHIAELTKIFNTPEIKNGLKGVLIIDDEADQASLNNFGRKNSKKENWEDPEKTSTYENILKLCDALPNYSYVQYTATPQAPLLINIMDLLSPKFHVVLTPGKKYTGGKAFFGENADLIITIPDEQVYHHKKNQLQDCPESLTEALQLFFIAVAIVVNIEEEEPYLSMMVHAASETDASKTFLNWVTKRINVWIECLEAQNGDINKIELTNNFRKIYEEATIRMQKDKFDFDTVMLEVKEILKEVKTHLVIGETKNVKNKKAKAIEWNSAIAHILVGADMLNRGYTVEKLAVSYMPRHSLGKSNADTIQQRCRFFGYKQNYLDSCRIFLPNDAIKEYCEYIDHEELFREKIKGTTLKELEQYLILGDNINATRSNVLSIDTVTHKMNGWRKIQTPQSIDENRIFVENFLSKQDFKEADIIDYDTQFRRHRYIRFSIKEIIDFLRDYKITNMPDALRKSSTIEYLRYLESNKKIEFAYIFEMSFEAKQGRGRELRTGNGKLEINNIFSGKTPEKGDKPTNNGTNQDNKYPGDDGICFENYFCIQIHRIRLENSSHPLDKKIAYMLGIYYPPILTHSFVGKDK